jgi:hypothetical protein
MDRLMVSDAVAQPPQLIELGMEGTAPYGRVERVTQSGLPKSAVVLVGQQRPPEAERQLGDDLAVRAGRAAGASLSLCDNVARP